MADEGETPFGWLNEALARLDGLVGEVTGRNERRRTEEAAERAENEPRRRELHDWVGRSRHLTPKEVRPDVEEREVESSWIKSVGFAADGELGDERFAGSVGSGTLAVTVKAKRGRPEETYYYPGVPKETFDAFADAESKGQFFNWWIKPEYAFLKGSDLRDA